MRSRVPLLSFRRASEYIFIAPLPAAGGETLITSCTQRHAFPIEPLPANDRDAGKAEQQPRHAGETQTRGESQHLLVDQAMFREPYFISQGERNTKPFRPFCYDW